MSGVALALGTWHSSSLCAPHHNAPTALLPSRPGAKVLLIVTATPTVDGVQETICSLNFAQRISVLLSPLPGLKQMRFGHGCDPWPSVCKATCRRHDRFAVSGQCSFDQQPPPFWLLTEPTLPPPTHPDYCEDAETHHPPSLLCCEQAVFSSGRPRSTPRLPRRCAGALPPIANPRLLHPVMPPLRWG